jgi:hypothetical protein
MLAERTIVCICGSTRFLEAFRQANYEETMKGNIVLTIGCDVRTDDDLFGDISPEDKAAIKLSLDNLHLDKVELAHEVLILNVGGYIGPSTRRELEHAQRHRKVIRFLEK